jgi:hypothetical protein
MWEAARTKTPSEETSEGVKPLELSRLSYSTVKGALIPCS